MDTLKMAPGVIKRSSRIFITREDVSILFGCSRSKAYDIVSSVNKYAKKIGKYPMQSGKANKYLFADMYSIPIEEVDNVINQCGEV